MTQKTFILVGLAGRAGHGKSEVSKILRRTWMADADNDRMDRVEAEVAFADPIKDAVQAMFGYDRKTLEYWKRTTEPVPPLHRSMRVILQTLGTDWGRDTIQPDIWLRLWEHRVKDLQHKLGYGTRLLVVVPDVRFQNEVTLIKSLGGVVVEVVRPDYEEGEDHASELQELENVDEVVMNDSTLSRLHAKAVQLYYRFVEEDNT